MEAATGHQEMLVTALRKLLGEQVEMVETHISWVLLAGDYAYKIKKAVNLGFLDFSSLEKRHHYCEEELRLNKRLATELYLAAIPISGSVDHPVLGGFGTPLEYAVKMRRFPQSCLLDQMLERGELTAPLIDAIAHTIADFHGQTGVTDNSSNFGTAEQVHLPVMENFSQIRPRLHDNQDLINLNELEHWSEREYQSHIDEFTARKAQGFIRECHGDLHLGNMALLDGKVVPFDCIEFNGNLRWIDVISEAAFLTMDLQDRGRPDLAYRFINAYLEQTGDYDGLKLFRYYLVYRAMVRAKVACIRAEQKAWSEECMAQYRKHIALAGNIARRAQPILTITHGLSGSGKTTITQALLETVGMFRVRSDVERKRLHGLKPETRSNPEIGEGIYSAAASESTYRRLAELAKTIVQSGYPAIIDAAFLKTGERAKFNELAEQLQVRFVIIDCKAPTRLLHERVERRMQLGRDASEADTTVLEKQMRNSDPLNYLEVLTAIEVNTEQGVNMQALAQRLKQFIYR